MNKIYYPFAICVLFFYSSCYLENDNINKAVCAEIMFPNNAKLNCEIAKTPSEQILGLMFRKKLKENSGMLFVFSEERERTFWMKNTYVSLDIIFIDKKKKVNKIFHGVRTYNSEMKDFEIPRVNAVGKYVLEISSGIAKVNNLKEGDKIAIKYIKSKDKCE